MKAFIEGYTDEMVRGFAMLATGAAGLTVSDIVAEHWMKMVVGAVTVSALIIQTVLAVMKHRRGQ